MKLGDVVNPEAQHWGKPLTGVRILALEQMQALPYATQLLGASVPRWSRSNRPAPVTSGEAPRPR